MDRRLLWHHSDTDFKLARFWQEMDHLELGRAILDRLVVDVTANSMVESMPRVEGRNMVMLLAPKKIEGLEKPSKEQPA